MVGKFNKRTNEMAVENKIDSADFLLGMKKRGSSKIPIFKAPS